MGRFFNQLVDNPSNIRSIDDLLRFTQDRSEEKWAEYGGATRFVKAWENPLTDPQLQDMLAQRLTKGSEIKAILDDYKCHALLMPVGCRNPGDLGQCPIMSLPMGYYSSEKERTLDKFSMTLTGPNIP